MSSTDSYSEDEAPKKAVVAKKADPSSSSDSDSEDEAPKKAVVAKKKLILRCIKKDSSKKAKLLLRKLILRLPVIQIQKMMLPRKLP